jgi:hypothetical protein
MPAIWREERILLSWGPMQYTRKMHVAYSGSYVCPDWESCCATCQGAKLWREVKDTQITFNEFRDKLNEIMDTAWTEDADSRMKVIQDQSTPEEWDAITQMVDYCRDKI